MAHVIMVYNGPVAPHWEMKVRYGDQKMLDDFWARVQARLLLLPKHDPQFRRNRERVNRDAERELIICDWDLGEGDAESTSTPSSPPVAAVPDTPAGDAEPEVADEVAEAEPEPESAVEADDDVADGEDAAVDAVAEPEAVVEEEAADDAAPEDDAEQG